MYILIAWRNLWRNKRRSIISISSVCFAVLLATFMRALQLGSYELMVDNVVGQFTGHLQIHSKAYKTSQSLDESFQWDESLNELMNKKDQIRDYSKRVESFVLMSTGEMSKGVGIIGIEPQNENRLTKLESRLIKGKYLTDQSEGLLIASGLAKKLNATVGDSVILYGQGLYGMIAANIFEIEGLLEFPSPDLNNRMAFVSLNTAQSFFYLDDRVTSASIMIRNPKHLLGHKLIIDQDLADDLIVETWEELLPDLVQMIEMDNASGLIILIILYMVIAFGLFGTTMMIALERKHEIATLISIGMHRGKMMTILTLESFFLSFIGLIVGLVITIPIVYYFHYVPIELTGEMAEMMISYGMEPIMPTSIDPYIFMNQLLIVAGMALFTAIYPILTVKNLNLMKALRD